HSARSCQVSSASSESCPAMSSRDSSARASSSTRFSSIATAPSTAALTTDALTTEGSSGLKYTGVVTVRQAASARRLAHHARLHPHRARLDAPGGPVSTAPPPAQAAPDTPGTPAAGLAVLPVPGLGEIREGDDLAGLLAEALTPLAPQDGDVLCVSTKIVSKAQGLRVPAEQRDRAVADLAVRTVARRLHTRVVTSVVQIPSGPVMAAGGVDSSNAPEGPLLLPEDPDACARGLRAALSAALDVDLGVLLTDTSSRIWRVGVGDIALGAAGV